MYALVKNGPRAVIHPLSVLPPEKGANSTPGDRSALCQYRHWASVLPLAQRSGSYDLAYLTLLSVETRRPDRFRGLASHSAGAPAHGSAGLADGGSGHAVATDHCPTYAAAEANLRDHAVRLRNRRGRHCLRRSCDGQGKAGNRNQSDHSSPPFYPGLF